MKLLVKHLKSELHNSKWQLINQSIRSEKIQDTENASHEMCALVFASHLENRRLKTKNKLLLKRAEISFCDKWFHLNASAHQTEMKRSVCGSIGISKCRTIISRLVLFAFGFDCIYDRSKVKWIWESAHEADFISPKAISSSF